MGGSLKVEVHSRPEKIPVVEWRRLLPDYPDPCEMASALATSGDTTASLHVIMVKEGECPVLLLPLAKSSSGPKAAFALLARRLAQRFIDLLPALLRPASELAASPICWSYAGTDPDAPAEVIEQARLLASDVVAALSAVMPLDVVPAACFVGGETAALSVENLVLS